MTPFLSVVVPALNEQAYIAAFIERMRAELSSRVPSWEIVVVDDGSTDRTREIVEAHAREDPRVRFVAGPHRGKGAALRRGMLAATGTWRFMADADLSMPPDNIARFLDAAADGDAEIIVGSREAPGARRTGEPWTRHVVGRVFNWIVRLLAVPGIQDTQCGFKLLSAGSVEAIFPLLTLDGFAFDVELLHCARKRGYAVREVGIVWHARADSRVGLRRGAAAFLDVLRIRLRHRTYATWAWLLTAVFAAGIAYDLVRMPVQVYDALGEILDAHKSPSVWASFQGALGSAGYLRPLRIAQIKWLFDVSGGHYWATYRGFHALLLVMAMVLFTRALRVRTPSDFAAAAFALVVLMGMHTFLGTVQEAFPINHFLEIVVLSLAALNLSIARPGPWVDLAAVVTFAAAALTLESGLLVWVIAVTAWVCGLRGVSGRGIAAMTVALAGYFYLRFVIYPTGAPGLGERSAAFMFEVLERSAVQERFGESPLPFYVYNVLAAMASVLVGEPQRGLFVRPERWLSGDLPLRHWLAVTSCLLTTALIVWAALRRVRHGGFATAGVAERMVPVAATVLAANAVLSFAYTKDEVMSVGGVFYAIAAYAAVRHALAFAHGRPRTVPAALVMTVLLVTSVCWTIRSAGVHHVLRSQAFRQRNDWAVLPGRLRREGAWPSEAGAERVLLRLRDDAIERRAVNPSLLPRWANGVWGE